jgi:hypothetical protein
MKPPKEDDFGGSDLARMLVEYATRRRHKTFEPGAEDDEKTHLLHARICALSRALGFEQPARILSGDFIFSKVDARDPVIFHQKLEVAFPLVQNLEKALSIAVDSGSWSKTLDCNRALVQFFGLRRMLHEIEIFNDDWYASASSMNMTSHAALVAAQIREANTPFVNALDDAIGYLLDPYERTFSKAVLVAKWGWPEQEPMPEAESLFALHDALMEHLATQHPAPPDASSREE